MRALVVAEHDSKTIRTGSYSAAAFAQAIAAHHDGSMELLVLGHRIEGLVQSAARLRRCSRRITSCWPCRSRIATLPWSPMW